MYDERLSALDMAFLCLESAQAPLHLGALAIFEPERPIAPDRLLQVIRGRAERMPALRQRVQVAWLPPGSAVWADDDRFDLDRHVRLHQLDGGDQDELSVLASQLMAEPLDLDRPLWQLHIVTGLVGSRFAMLVKLHHALADGLRAVELGVALLDGFGDLLPAGRMTVAEPGIRTGAASAAGLFGTAAGTTAFPGLVTASHRPAWPANAPYAGLAPSSSAGVASIAPCRASSESRSLWSSLVQSARTALADRTESLTGLLPAGLTAVLAGGWTDVLTSAQPGVVTIGAIKEVVARLTTEVTEHLTTDAAIGVLRQAADLVGIASAVLSNTRLSAVPASIVGGPSHTPAPSVASRRLAVLRLDVGQVRQVRKGHGGTDNDVLLAVITGALREWLSHRRAERVTRESGLRALIPVSRRSRADDRRGGNILSGYLCDLPVHEEDPFVRLQRIKTTMQRNKAAGFGRGPGALPVLAAQVPAAVHWLTAPFARHGAGLLFDTMVTSVPLPSRSLSLDGARLREVYPIAPLPHGQPFGIALSTYQGRVHVGVHADRQAIPDLDRLARAVPAALGHLTATGAR